MSQTRIAVIADIHGNADALAAVLAHLDQQNPDMIVNLGDHFSGPLAAGETAALLHARPEMIAIRGNHDRYLIEQDPAEMGPSDAVAYAELSPETLDWLKALPATRKLDGMLLCHGTPQSDGTYWLEHLSGDQIAARPRDEVAQFADDEAIGLYLCAHTHIPRSVRLPSGAWVINPGSVGCPAYDDAQPVPHVVETGHPAASYAIVERDAEGLTAIQHHLVPYDTTRMARNALAAGRDGWARGVSTGWYRS